MGRIRQVNAALSALLLLLVAGLSEASIVLPLTLAALASQSDVVVIGRVTGLAAAVDPAVDGIYTYVTIQPSEILKGPSQAGPIIVKQLGGVDGARGAYLVGQPTFSTGEEVLLFLKTRTRDGSLFTIGLWQGKWTIAIDPATGQRVAFEREPKTEAVLTSSPLAAVRAELARRAAFETNSVEINTAPAETPRQSSPFAYYEPPVRWVQPVVSVNVETGAQPGLAGGGLAQIGAAVAQWNAAGSSLTLRNGERLLPRCLHSGGFDILITFDDPCGEISSDPNLLAATLVRFNLSGQPINGQTFLSIISVGITTSPNPEAQAMLTAASCFQSTLAHELGHAVGLGHTPDASALMFASLSQACLQGPIPLNADDVAGLFTIYPTAGTPPTGGGPGQPTVTNVSASGGTLQLTWTSGSGATPTAHRLEFFAGGSLVASLAVGAGTTASLPIPPGTSGSFSVRITALAGSTSGLPSDLFTFTIGASGGCTAAPAAPVVTGSIVAGTATVSWPAVPGATSYITSAGSTQGATNISGPTNIGPTTTIRASGLSPGFSAWVRVVAVNACGQGPPGDFFLFSGSGPPLESFMRFVTGPDSCSCWTNPIYLEVDGHAVGTMACSESAGPFSVSPGAHTFRVCHSVRCLDNDTFLNPLATLTVTLYCQ